MGSIGAALPIIGGAFGPIGGAVGALAGGLLGGDQNQARADAANSEGLREAEFPFALYEHYAPGLLASIQKMIDDPTKFGLKQDASTNPLVFGDQAKALVPGFDTMTTRYADNGSNQLQQNSGALNAELAGRGFNGANSIAPSAEEALVRGTASDVAGNKSAVGVQAGNALYDRGRYAASTGYEQSINNAQRILQALGMINPGNPSTIGQFADRSQGLASSEFGGINDLLTKLGPLFGGKGGGIFSGIFGHHGGPQTTTPTTFPGGDYSSVTTNPYSYNNPSNDWMNPTPIGG